MTEDEANSLLNEIERAFESKDLIGVLKYYHPEITYIGPAFQRPLEGIEALKAAFIQYFGGPQRSKAAFKNIKVRNFSADSFLVHCAVEGSRFIYLTEERFRGYLSRVFVAGEGGIPLIIHEHFSLLF